MAYLDPCRRFHSFAILDVALLSLWLQKRCGLDLNLNLPFLDGHRLGSPQQTGGFETANYHFLEFPRQKTILTVLFKVRCGIYKLL
jgi:hypothetical protein